MTDFALESTLDFKFTTRRFTTGVPFALAAGVISAYPDNGTTQITAGITLSPDFDGVVGLNNIRVVATAANGYAAGVSYALVITVGTIDSVSVVGEVVREFTLARGAAFGRLGAPAGASVSADVAAIKSVVDLVKTAVDAIKVTTDKFVFTITNKVDASIQAAGDFAQAAADKVWASTTRTLSAFSTALAVSVWDVLASAVATASSIGVQVKTNLDATVSSRSSHSAADVWASGTRTLTSFGTLVADVATAVWAAGTRELTGFGSLVADVTTAVWSAAVRELTGFGSLASDLTTAVWTAGVRELTGFGSLIADTTASVWGAGSRTLTSFGSLVTDIWASGTRTLTSFSTLVADVATAVWAAAARTLTAFSLTASANVTQIGGSTATLDRLKRVTDSEILGTVGVGSLVTSIVTSSLDPPAIIDDQFKGRVVLFDRATTTTVLRGQGTRITASTSSGVLTAETLTTAPVSGDTFTIV